MNASKLMAHLSGWLTVAVFLCGQPVLGHKLSDSYLTLKVQEGATVGEWHLALRDLEDAIGLDADDNGSITWGELRAAESRVAAYGLARLHVDQGGKNRAFRVVQMLVDEHADGAYAVLRFTVDDLDPAAPIVLNYAAFFDIDPSHRGLVRLVDGPASRLAIFSPNSSVQLLEFQGRPSRSSSLTLLREGIWHIWGGYDHLLFLMALLLPGVLRREGTRWTPQSRPRLIVADVLKTVTAFTLAHSITLAMAAFGWLRPPSRLIESTIAASVVFAAANNLAPRVSRRGWVLAFIFGLVHGFGFANALASLGLAPRALAGSLLAFNVGVELGQVAVVALMLPVAIGLRYRPIYRQRLLPIGSVAIGAIAAAWFVERAFDLHWLPF